MKKLYLVTFFLAIGWMILYVFTGFFQMYIGKLTEYTLVVLTLLLKLLASIFIARFSRYIGKNMSGKILKKKKMTLVDWTSYTQDIDGEIQAILGRSRATSHIVVNLENIKYQIGLYFQKDIKKLKNFKAYLNVVEKDNTFIALQTFIFAIISSGFVSIITTGKVKEITKNYVIPISEGKILGTFYYASGSVFLWFFIMIIVAYMMSYTDKTRIRIMQEVIDIYIDELEEEKKEVKGR
ncbi:hypothetical protein [Bacillus cereus]|uniref:hypothetical protein n=1 Tax=Bacillus cereus TaxID=1396 RepID=UPI000BF3D980|nr:hypothetical protein [Bacillus cereus]PFC94994.1 hypothetical protein CN308_18245 [Bacillus cereus]